MDVDDAQIIKPNVADGSQTPERKYSPPRIGSVETHIINGNPDRDLISASYVERLNATTRLHMRRLTRLPLAFSKKLGNFKWMWDWTIYDNAWHLLGRGAVTH